MAKSVPQRMAIISAGVIMNLIFAVIFAAIAYRNGVRYLPCVIGATSPGDPAWVAGIEPGDKIVKIDGQPQSEFLRFDHDLKMNVILTGTNDSLAFGIRRYGTDQVDTIPLRPADIDKAHKDMVIIGVTPCFTTTLAADPTFPDSPAARAKPAFAAGDKITHVQVGATNHACADYFRLERILEQFPDEPLTFEVERPDAENPSVPPKTLKIEVARNPRHTLGIVMAMQPIEAIQKGSPAEQAGFHVGDRLISVNGKDRIDPLRLEEVLRPLVGQEATIVVARPQKGGQPVEVKLTVKLRARATSPCRCPTTAPWRR